MIVMIVCYVEALGGCRLALSERGTILPSLLHAATVDFSTLTPLAEIVLLAGNAHDPTQARQTLQGAYQPDDDYDNVVGISVLFKAGATADFLAQEGGFRHNRISVSVLAKLLEELASIQHELVLFVTPMPQAPFFLPDHHTLAVAQGGMVKPTLDDAVAEALMRSFLVVKNPYKRP